MPDSRPSAVAVAAAAALALTGLPDVARSQSLLDRPPNLSGGWLGAPGTLQFNFVHRFRLLSPTNQVNNNPTFLLAYRLGPPVLLGINYATSSFVAPGKPNELEAFARVAALAAERGAPLDLSVQLGYQQAAKSVDGEVMVGRQAGPARLFAAARYLSNGYATDTTRYAVGGGATLRLHRNVALAGDVTTLLDRRAGEEVAWSAGLQLAIPYSPHTLSLHVTNVTTATLQGSARGTNIRRAGFEFTVPIRLRRSGGQAAVTAGAGGSAAVIIRQMTFPTRVEAAASATVEWTNQDAVIHTVTADDGMWDSGPIAPGATWRRTFERAGDYAYHCTPHPYMKGLVVVR